MLTRNLAGACIFYCPQWDNQLEEGAIRILWKLLVFEEGLQGTMGNPVRGRWRVVSTNWNTPSHQEVRN